eukprot:CAMPEP_0117452618 /NCGR_PEP_ID=MMETSP0759-20121206/9725_1 /TAXON_ID=63605 /ORGANISM="Percolomonas cosmopolitus, Strain WS" /LENGTH=1192 /DNA_ID=CAMNT_0005245473 /DNA_START=107 /DNA_END=3685 /DNA_ORIENTATION=-
MEPFVRLLSFERGLISNGMNKKFGAAFTNNVGVRLDYKFVCACETFSVALAYPTSEGGQKLAFMGSLTGRFGENVMENFPKIAGIIDIESHGEIVNMACGSQHILLQSSRGRLLVFGAGNFGQLGLGLDPQLVAVPIVHYMFDNITSVSASGKHSMVLDIQGRVWHWGEWDLMHSSLSHSKSKDTMDFSASFSPIQLEMRQTSKSIATTPRGGFIVGLDSCLYGFGRIFSNHLDTLTKLDYSCTIQSVFASSYDIILLNADGQMLRSSINGVVSPVPTTVDFPPTNTLKNIVMKDGLNIFTFENDPLMLLVQHNHSALTEYPITTFPQRVFLGADNAIEFLHCSSDHCMGIGTNQSLFSVGSQESRKSCGITPLNPTPEWISCNMDYLGINNVKIGTLDVLESRQLCKIVLTLRLSSEEWDVVSTSCSDANSYTVLALVQKKFPAASHTSTHIVIGSHDDTLYAFSIDQVKVELKVHALCDESQPCTDQASILHKFSDFRHVSFGVYWDPEASYFTLTVFHVPLSDESPSAIWLVRQRLNASPNIAPFFRLPHAYSFFVINRQDVIHSVFMMARNRIVIYYPSNHVFDNFSYSRSQDTPEMMKLVTGGLNSTYVLSGSGRISAVQFDVSNKLFDLLELSLPTDYFIEIASLSSGELFGLDESGQVFSYTPGGTLHALPITESVPLSEPVSSMNALSVAGYEGLSLLHGVTCNSVSASDFRVCSAHGLCLFDDSCSCYTGYYGKTCSFKFHCFGFDPDDPRVCGAGNGTCVSQDKCKCENGRFGDNCAFVYPCNDVNTIQDGKGGCMCRDTSQQLFMSTCFSVPEYASIIGSFIAVPLFITLCCVALVAICSICTIGSCCYIRKRVSDKKHHTILQGKEHLLQSYERDHELDLIDTDTAFFELKKEFFEIDQQELTIEKKLGSGGQGTVFRATWAELPVAVKYFNCKLLSGERIFDEFNREATLMSSIRHPCIVSFYGATLSFPRIGLVVEYAPEGSVDQLISSGKVKMLPKKQLFKILVDVCDAMIFLHSRKTPIIHRDLKWQNVLLWMSNDTEYHAKITDFGMSRIQDVTANESMTSNVGTSLYLAPENFKGERYDASVDMYAFGIMIFELLVGHMNPWSLDEEYDNLQALAITSRAANDAEFRPNVKHLKGAGWAVVVPMCENCWAHNPSDRPSFKEVKDFFQSLKDMVD